MGTSVIEGASPGIYFWTARETDRQIVKLKNKKVSVELTWRPFQAYKRCILKLWRIQTVEKNSKAGVDETERQLHGKKFEKR